MKPAKITTSAAERFSESVRADIRTAPIPNIDNIFQTKDTDAMISLMNDTWFGVPESRSYIDKLSGYWEMVGLLEDPPEED
jgi:hypothetical protein